MSVRKPVGDTLRHANPGPLVAEEIENATTVIPRSMIISVLLNGTLGFGMLIAILFSIGTVDQVLNSGLPIAFIGIFERTTNSAAGATALVSLPSQVKEDSG